MELFKEITFIDDNEILVDLEARRKLTKIIQEKYKKENAEIFARMIINKFRLKVKYNENIEKILDEIISLII